jgi:hypothetical protein
MNGSPVVLGAGFGMIQKVCGALGRKWILLLALLCVPGWLHAQTPPPANYYVATTGSDSNNGTTPTTPFANITHALTLCTGGQTVAVASGTYSTLTWTGTLGGTPTGAVVYDNIVRTSMVTVIGWGATPPLIQPPSTEAYMAVWINGGSYLTFDNFVMHSNNGYPLFDITSNWATGTPRAKDITVENCDLSDPDSGDPNFETFCVANRSGADNITVQNCNIHDSSAGIGGDGEATPTTASNNIQILNNTLKNFSSDAIQFANWNNVLIDGNTIENMADVANDSLHNDGIQFGGDTQNATISNNVIAHSNGQLILIAIEAGGPVDNVLVENNVIWDSGGFAIQNSGATHAKFINNTVFKGALGGLLVRSSGSVAPNDTVVANNYLCSFGYYQGASGAYEDYNYLPAGEGTGAHDIHGTTPDFVNTTDGNFHPAAGSPLFGAGIQSFSAIVDGTPTNFTAPAVDLDFITRGNPPTIGAYETTAGNSSIAYCGFDYATTGKASTLTDGAADYGWVEPTWSGGTVVSPGLAYSTLPTLGLALSNAANLGASRTINSSDMPAGYTVLGSDGITRLGKAGTTVWLSGIIEPTSSASATTNIELDGQSGGGGDKLNIGEVNATTTSWGMGNSYSGTYAFATGAAPIQTGVAAYLVVEIQFTTGNSIINLWVDPPLGDTPPATPDATLSTVQVGTFNILGFVGVRTSTGDEFNVGTSWLSVTSGGL